MTVAVAENAEHAVNAVGGGEDDVPPEFAGQTPDSQRSWHDGADDLGRAVADVVAVVNGCDDRSGHVDGGSGSNDDDAGAGIDVGYSVVGAWNLRVHKRRDAGGVLSLLI